MSSSLQLAQRALLTAHGLEAGHLEQVFGKMLAHRVDYADLYFQYSRAESWSLEEGIVKSGSFSIDQGVGVRAVSGDKTAFAYSDDITLSALEDAALATRAIARQGGKQKAAHLHAGRAHELYLPHRPDRHARKPNRKSRCWKGWNACARARSARYPGHGQSGRRIRSGAGGAQRRLDERRHQAAGAPLAASDRREAMAVASRVRRAAAGVSATTISATRYCSAMPARRCIRPSSISTRVPRRQAT